MIHNNVIFKMYKIVIVIIDMEDTLIYIILEILLIVVASYISYVFGVCIKSDQNSCTIMCHCAFELLWLECEGFVKEKNQTK